MQIKQISEAKETNKYNYDGDSVKFKLDFDSYKSIQNFYDGWTR